MNRDDFPILRNNLVYFDNGATTLKPKVVVDSIVSYYEDYTANAHRGDYKNSAIVDEKYEGVREKIREYINADKNNEIVFTSGTTDSLNLIVFGFFRNYLKYEDEVIITESEHASLALPWFVLEKELGIKIKYISLNDNNEITLDNLKKVVTSKTKVISLAYITNVIGDVRPLTEIGEYAKDNNILLIVDGAQSMGHKKIDVKKMNIDFLGFSGHKMYGPTGIGVMYAKEELMNEIKPINYGGGMNVIFKKNGYFCLREIPLRLESGTPNIAGVIGLGEAINYIENININKIEGYEKKLRQYLVSRLKEIKNIKIYNEFSKGSIVTFNIGEMDSHVVSKYLDKYNICVRAGNHCAKMLNNVFGTLNTCRISLSFYNTVEEVDFFINVLKML